MTHEEQPSLSLGEPPKRLAKGRGGFPRGLRLVVFLQVLLCIGLTVLFFKSGNGGAVSSGVNASTAEELRSVAIALEDRSLDAEAARQWEAYLQTSTGQEDEQRAQILYRIGKLYMQAERFSDAAGAFVRADQAAENDEDLAAKIGPNLVECLRRLGRYGEVGRELSRRVEVGADETGKGKVLATFAGESLTDADLDRMIERRVDEMLAVGGPAADPAQRNALLKQFSQPAMRQRLLQELLQTELFSRRARELELDKSHEFLQARRFLEENLLAGRFLSKELEKIQPTDVDVEAYYKAHQKQYQESESMTVQTIDLQDKSDVKVMLEKIKSSEDFKKLAAEQQGDDVSKKAPAAPKHVVRGRPDLVLGNVDELFQLSKGQWTKQPHAGSDGRKFLVLVEDKTPARTPPLSEIRFRVEADYRARKQQELSEKLFHDLMSRYDVRIHLMEKPAEKSGGKAPETEKPKPKATAQKPKHDRKP